MLSCGDWQTKTESYQLKVKGCYQSTVDGNFSLNLEKGTYSHISHKGIILRSADTKLEITSQGIKISANKIHFNQK